MSQLKKLVFDKKLTDVAPGKSIATWKINPWKLFFLMIGIAVLLIAIYGLFFVQPGGQGDFFGGILFYVIVLVVAIAILWIVVANALKFRKMIFGFFLAFILIICLYWFLGAVLGYFKVLDFHMGGYSLWILITILAGIGAKRIDGDLDKMDVLYGLLVLLIIVGANLPITGECGFLALLDKNIFEPVVHAMGGIL